VISSTKPS